MGRKKTKPEPEILNPRYAGATPDMVARALLRREPEDAEDAEASSVIAETDVRSSI